ncbi:Ltp family lipoprotein [Nocardioides pinisoli]|uniref:Ltp family lipoprotein n=1 Tax=Nocardioides pinisoli TaxID=2950279 RepID=A0ABT1L1E3_9ACTN|nr:Ltp family lipoprotein [Nocardioides pinisoli]MCP3423817.1 Ltp family lipoprotein [Nocardioides pinisoli]
MKKIIIALTTLFAVVVPVTTASPASASPRSQAVSMAYGYLQTMPFSKGGLADQLEYEGFSPAVANWAVSNIRVNWRKQAARMAKNYLRTMPFSCSGLIDQLVFEQFSYANASYGANQTRAC